MKYLKQYIIKYYQVFASYQDSIETSSTVLYHSILSPLLNIGLLYPQEVIHCIIRLGLKLETVEALVRQICGWREYMYYIYNKHLNHILHCRSFSRFNVPTSWYSGNTPHPIFNQELQKTQIYSYAHHIVRLMVFLNLMTLYRFNPESVILWFKRVCSIDAYDWVMVSNVYCMGYYCKHFTSKSYNSSSAYILRMSNSYNQRDALWDSMYKTSLIDTSRKHL